MQELWKKFTFVENWTISLVYVSYGGVQNSKFAILNFSFTEIELSLKTGVTRIDQVLINKVKYSDFQ